ncbi:MAG: transporter [Mucilaginibacter sp.]|nr:transporter [Mucilaginibacter sp.]
MATKTTNKIHPALWGLTISAFGIGTTELVIVGLLPTVAKDLDISISYTGLLVTLYALGVAIGGPILTALTGRISRKKLVLGLMLLFITGNALAAVAPNFGVLVLGRILSGFAHGVFFAIGATIAGSLVSPEKRGTAIAIMFAGLTIAMVTGVPLGTFVGQHWGWRATFTGVAGLGLIGFLSNLLLLPATIPLSPAVAVKDQFKVLKNGPILLVLSTTAFAFAGTFTTFTYLATLLEKITGFSPNSISLILLVYGIAIALGNVIGGKAANKNPARALVIMFLLLTAVLLILSVVITMKTATVIVLFLMGIMAFCNVPALQLYIVQLAEKNLPGTENIASALNIAAFNAGIALGAFVGGKVVDSSLSVKATPWVGAIFGVIACVLSFVSWKRETKVLAKEEPMVTNAS